MSNNLDISASNLKVVLKILNEYIPEHTVLAFGSRVNQTAKKFSDLDLAIKTNEPLSLLLLAELKEAFSASELPIKVDILDWSRISKEFQNIILKQSIILKPGCANRE